MKRLSICALAAITVASLAVPAMAQNGNNHGLSEMEQFRHRARKSLTGNEGYFLRCFLQRADANEEWAVIHAVNRASDQNGAMMWPDNVAVSSTTSSLTTTNSDGSTSTITMTYYTNPHVGMSWDEMNRSSITDGKAWEVLRNAVSGDDRVNLERAWMDMNDSQRMALLHMVKRAWAVTPVTEADMACIRD